MGSQVGRPYQAVRLLIMMLNRLEMDNIHWIYDNPKSRILEFLLALVDLILHSRFGKLCSDLNRVNNLGVSKPGQDLPTGATLQVRHLLVAQPAAPPVVPVPHRPHCRVVFRCNCCCRIVPVCQTLRIRLSKHPNCYSLQHLLRNGLLVLYWA